MTAERSVGGPEPKGPLSTSSTATPEQGPVQAAEVRASLFSWLPRLFFRPGKFFAENARMTPTFVTAICAYIFGVSWSLSYYMSPERRAELPKETAAAYVFGATLVYAILGGLFWYFLAGTWYGVRVSLCKPEGMTWKLSRRAFIFSELVYALPCVIGLTIWWVIQDQFFLLAALIVIGLFMFWSVYVSYRGARTLFRAARVRAVVLFILLPSIFYAACFAAFILLSNAESRLAKVDAPFEDRVFVMRRPANWVPVKSPGPGVVLFHIPDVGSFVATVKDSQGGTVDLEQTARAMAQKLAADSRTAARELNSFSTWGSYFGHGLRVSMNVDGNETIARIFCGSLPDGRVLITNEISLIRAESELEPQFQVARMTLKVKAIK